MLCQFDLYLDTYLLELKAKGHPDRNTLHLQYSHEARFKDYLAGTPLLRKLRMCPSPLHTSRTWVHWFGAQFSSPRSAFPLPIDAPYVRSADSVGRNGPRTSVSLAGTS